MPFRNSHASLTQRRLTTFIRCHPTPRRDGGCWDDGWGRLRRPGAPHDDLLLLPPVWGRLRRPGALHTMISFLYISFTDLCVALLPYAKTTAIAIKEHMCYTGNEPGKRTEKTKRSTR